MKINGKKLDVDTIFSIFAVIKADMGTKEKLIQRFLNSPKDFTYDEVLRLFSIFGYCENTKGGTSGSRVEFVNEKDNSSYIMHKPHPGNIIKGYMMRQLLSFVLNNRLIDKYKGNKKKGK